VLTKIRSHASFSNVVAVTALFVALGGTSYAATRIGSKQIKNNSVRSVDIKNRTIKSRDIAKGVIGSTLQSTAGQATRDVGPTGIGASQSFTPVATLGGLEPGAYVLLAKVNQSGNQRTDGRCRIQAEGDYDDSNRGLREQGTSEGHNLQLLHTFAGTGTAVLACRASAGAWSASDAKLLAIKISAARSNVVSG
jgi:hypothetical protein